MSSLMKRGSAGSMTYDSRPRMPTIEMKPLRSVLLARRVMSIPVAAAAIPDRVGLSTSESRPGLLRSGTSRLHDARQPTQRVAMMCLRMVMPPLEPRREREPEAPAGWIRRHIDVARDGLVAEVGHLWIEPRVRADVERGARAARQGRFLHGPEPLHDVLGQVVVDLDLAALQERGALDVDGGVVVEPLLEALHPGGHVIGAGLARVEQKPRQVDDLR